MVESGMGDATIEAGLKQFLLVLCVSLSVATLPRMLGWFRQIPYTLMLVIVGLGLAALNVHLVSLSPELILFIFLPPLLFEAAWNLRWDSLKQYLVPVCLFAVVGVGLAIAGITVGLTQIAGVGLAAALLIGACLSATDPVSVVALFRELGASKQLVTVLEGESLFNDGMAVVAFGFLVGFAVGETQLALQPVLLQLLVFVGVGLAIGLLIGFSISYLTQRFDLPLVEQSLTLIAAYGAYLLAEELGGSGVIATVSTGLILGNFGSRIGMNPRTRVIVSEFWEFLAFFVNSIVFLLIGVQIRFAELVENADLIVITIVVMTLARLGIIYLLSLVSNRFSQAQLTLPEQTVLAWGGLRGSVSIALALSVPSVVQERPEITATIFGAVLFTLLVQGLTIKPMLSAFKLLTDQATRQQYMEAIARRTALQRVMDYLQQAENRPGIESQFYTYQMTLLKGEMTSIEQEIDKLDDEYPNVREFAQEQLKRELLAIEADTYAELVQSGQLNRELPLLLEE